MIICNLPCGGGTIQLLERQPHHKLYRSQKKASGARTFRLCLPIGVDVLSIFFVLLPRADWYGA